MVEVAGKFAGLGRQWQGLLGVWRPRGLAGGGVGLVERPEKVAAVAGEATEVSESGREQEKG